MSKFPIPSNEISLALQTSLEDENNEAPARFHVITAKRRRWGKGSHSKDSGGPVPHPSSDLLNDLSFSPLQISISLTENLLCQHL